MSPGSARKGRARAFRLAYQWVSQFWDPLRTARALRSLPRFVDDWRRYAGLPGAESLRLADAQPQLQDRTVSTPIDAHYFFTNGWAARAISRRGVRQHVDVASHVDFVNLLAAFVPVVFVDYRPLVQKVSGLHCLRGSAVALPFVDGSLMSVSCLHVAEHIGLGRYGDPLDPAGTRKAACELARVLAPGGDLYFAVPVGRPRVCFNAHRVHAAATVLEYFPNLVLASVAGVLDDGRFREDMRVEEFDDADYACGLFHFRKPI